MTIDHIGYAVRSLDRALGVFGGLGFRFDGPIEDADRNIRLAFGEKDGYRVELVAPLERSAPSPVDAYLSKIGPTAYHICYASENMEQDIALAQKQGFRVVIEPAPAVAFGGRRVAFLMDLACGLVEIAEVCESG